MRIFLLAFLSCLWIGTARADLIGDGPRRGRRQPHPYQEEMDAAGGAALAAAIAAAGLALAKKKKKAEKSPEELMIDQDGQVEEDGGPA